MKHRIKKMKASRLAGRRFALSALIASIVIILGEQASIALRSPVYFQHIGEWIWNLFVSTSFLWTIVTLYGFAGGACWQALVALVRPSDRLLALLYLSHRDARADRMFAAWLIGTLVAVGSGTVTVFVLQLHFSTAYNNKPLAAFVFTGCLFLLFPIALAVYMAVSRSVARLAVPLERWLPNRLFPLAVLLVLTTLSGIIVQLVLANSYLFEILDPFPFMVVGLFFLSQLALYFFFLTPPGEEALAMTSNLVSAGAWLLIVGFMLATTLAAYPSQTRVAGILRNHSLFSKPLIIATQKIADKDGDGFAAILRGGDCNDDNPLVHPMAQEIPENGIDDDCMGGDSARPLTIRQEKDPMLALRIESIRQPYNIFLITIDALRADHVGDLGYERPTTPELDELATQSVVFTSTYAQAPNTPQSIPSLITGLYPSQIHWGSYANFPKIKSRTPTVMDHLKGRDYHVAGIFSYWYFRKRNLQRNADWWDNRAFRQRGHAESHMTSDLVTDFAIEHLEQLDQTTKPLFMWLHYFDPHFLYLRHSDADFGHRQIDLYDGEVRVSSREVGRFIDYLKTTPFYENSVIVITADHGEEFKEHGRKYHGSQIYEESVRVPLIIHSSMLPPQRISDPVALVDIAPTLLDLVGEKSGRDSMQGQSLLPMILNGWEHGPVYIEKLKAPTFPWSLQALVDGRWKLIQFANEQRFELYDLENDPGEKRDLSDQLPEKTAQMQMQLSTFRLHTLTHDTGWYQMATMAQ